MPKGGPIFSRNPQWKRPLRGEVLMDDETRRKVRRRRLQRVSAACATICVIGALVGLYFSPVFRVNDVTVTGTTTLDANVIREAADLEDESMLTVDFAEAERKIEAMPLVASVTFERHLPNSVEIKVTERAPWGVWTVKDTQYLIDAEGVVLVGTPTAPLPTIIATSSVDPLNPGDRVDRDAVVLSQVLMNTVPAQLTQYVSGIEWSNAKGLTVTTDAGYRVVIGDSENVEYKLAVWGQIEAELGREAMGGHVLDLRFGDRPSLQ
jgi:cell division protein FtsQ